MKKGMLLILLPTMILTACQNKETSIKENIGASNHKSIASSSIEMYLLKDFKQLKNRCAIDETTTINETKPLLSSDDFISYNPETHTFVISEEATNKLKQMHFPVSGKAFSLQVDNQLIYTGYFYPSYSSSSCDWVVIDPMMTDYNEGLKVQLGYPALWEGMDIPDRRNDERILNAFKNNK